EGHEAPRGDLQGAFLALGATARSAANGEVTEEPLEDFMPKRDGRLLLRLSAAEPAAGAYAGLDRPHTHDYTALSVSGTRSADGTIRLAATGGGSHRPALPSGRAGRARPAAPAGRGGRRRGRRERRGSPRRRARVGLVPHEGAPRVGPPRPRRAEGV